MHNHPIASVIDDDESVRTAMSSLVRSLDWDVRLYASAEAFLASGIASNVACIISDVQMPGMSGLDMYRHLLEMGVTQPIIFISAFASDAVRRQALDLGAMCVLTKPVDGGEVSRCLAKVGPGSASGE
ncbi:response regulator [Paraburkholderia phymatum]|uniref:Response regulator receiver protein n=1 Tax=Paraburkholderia phymatum (strain DSM 17167 / CIP 108236 / LMG 21445 / STM815) TaxID=391038 RepID=B2JUY5_PARP8|nr:response regulator [Paraburkholderia phymatum]ACC74763.1 response regulator receiver protein [Paraburkholderia phymatum STM815]